MTQNDYLFVEHRLRYSREHAPTSVLHDEGADLGSFLPLLQIASGFCVNSREASYAVPGNPRGEQHGPAAVLRNEVKTPFDVLVPQASHEGHEVISPPDARLRKRNTIHLRSASEAFEKNVLKTDIGCNIRFQNVFYT